MQGSAKKEDGSLDAVPSSNTRLRKRLDEPLSVEPDNEATVLAYGLLDFEKKHVVQGGTGFRTNMPSLTPLLAAAMDEKTNEREQQRARDVCVHWQRQHFQGTGPDSEAVTSLEVRSNFVNA